MGRAAGSSNPHSHQFKLPSPSTNLFSYSDHPTAQAVCQHTQPSGNKHNVVTLWEWSTFSVSISWKHLARQLEFAAISWATNTLIKPRLSHRSVTNYCQIFALLRLTAIILTTEATPVVQLLGTILIFRCIRVWFQPPSLILECAWELISKIWESFAFLLYFI